MIPIERVRDEIKLSTEEWDFLVSKGTVATASLPKSPSISTQLSSTSSGQINSGQVGTLLEILAQSHTTTNPLADLNRSYNPSAGSKIRPRSISTVQPLQGLEVDSSEELTLNPMALGLAAAAAAASGQPIGGGSREETTTMSPLHALQIWKQQQSQEKQHCGDRANRAQGFQ